MITDGAAPRRLPAAQDRGSASAQVPAGGGGRAAQALRTASTWPVHKTAPFGGPSPDAAAGPTYKQTATRRHTPLRSQGVPGNVPECSLRGWASQAVWCRRGWGSRQPVFPGKPAAAAASAVTQSGRDRHAGRDSCPVEVPCWVLSLAAGPREGRAEAEFGPPCASPQGGRAPPRCSGEPSAQAGPGPEAGVSAAGQGARADQGAEQGCSQPREGEGRGERTEPSRGLPRFRRRKGHGLQQSPRGSPRTGLEQCKPRGREHG